MIYLSWFVVLQNAILLILMAYFIKNGDYKLDAPSFVIITYALTNFIYAMFGN